MAKKSIGVTMTREEYLHKGVFKKEEDPRRDKRKCGYYNCDNGHCFNLNMRMECPGSTHCDYYTEEKQEHSLKQMENRLRDIINEKYSNESKTKISYNKAQFDEIKKAGNHKKKRAIIIEMSDEEFRKCVDNKYIKLEIISEDWIKEIYSKYLLFYIECENKYYCIMPKGNTLFHKVENNMLEISFDIIYCGVVKLDMIYTNVAKEKNYGRIKFMQIKLK